VGIFKDLKDTASGLSDLTKAGKEAQKAQGMGGGFGLSGMAKMVTDANTMVQDVQEQQAKVTRLMSAGLVGQGTIKAIRDTGVQVNYQPQFEIDLEVTLPDRDPYQATITQVVAMSVLPQFQPGAVLPVRVDPQDPHVLMIG
jgi:hypothetical protein